MSKFELNPTKTHEMMLCGIFCHIRVIWGFLQKKLSGIFSVFNPTQPHLLRCLIVPRAPPERKTETVKLQSVTLQPIGD